MLCWVSLSPTPMSLQKVYPDTGGSSSSCEMIILRNNSHGRIIRVCMGIFTTALRNKKIRQILKKNTSPYFHSVLLVIWPLTLMKRTHFSELSISRFSTFIRKAQGWTLHFRTPDLRSKKPKLRMTGRPQIRLVNRNNSLLIDLFWGDPWF